MITNYEELPAERKNDFVKYYREEFTVAGACRRLGISRKIYYTWRKNDPEFGKDLTLAQEEMTEELEAEAKRRACDGVLRDIYFGPKVIGQKREYSDALLMFLLKAMRPEKYRERQDVNQRINGDIILNFIPAYEYDGDKIH